MDQVQLEATLGLAKRGGQLPTEMRDAGDIEIVAGVVLLLAGADVGIADPVIPFQIGDSPSALLEQRNALETVGDVESHRRQRHAGHLLQIPEVADVDAVQ